MWCVLHSIFVLWGRSSNFFNFSFFCPKPNKNVRTPSSSVHSQSRSQRVLLNEHPETILGRTNCQMTTTLYTTSVLFCPVPFWWSSWSSRSSGDSQCPGKCWTTAATKSSSSKNSQNIRQLFQVSRQTKAPSLTIVRRLFPSHSKNGKNEEQ